MKEFYWWMRKKGWKNIFLFLFLLLFPTIMFIFTNIWYGLASLSAGVLLIATGESIFYPVVPKGRQGILFDWGNPMVKASVYPDYQPIKPGRCFKWPWERILTTVTEVIEVADFEGKRFKDQKDVSIQLAPRGIKNDSDNPLDQLGANMVVSGTVFIKPPVRVKDGTKDDASIFKDKKSAVHRLVSIYENDGLLFELLMLGNSYLPDKDDSEETVTKIRKRIVELKGILFDRLEALLYGALNHAMRNFGLYEDKDGKSDPKGKGKIKPITFYGDAGRRQVQIMNHIHCFLNATSPFGDWLVWGRDIIISIEKFAATKDIEDLNQRAESALIGKEVAINEGDVEIAKAKKEKDAREIKAQAKKIEIDLEQGAENTAREKRLKDTQETILAIPDAVGRQVLKDVLTAEALAKSNNANLIVNLGHSSDKNIDDGIGFGIGNAIIEQQAKSKKSLLVDQSGNPLKKEPKPTP
ncbi:MAG: cell envelope integrity protein TolA [bacterium]